MTRQEQEKGGDGDVTCLMSMGHPARSPHFDEQTRPFSVSPGATSSNSRSPAAADEALLATLSPVYCGNILVRSNHELVH